MNHKLSEIEILDAKRIRYLELYLVGVGVFIVLSITRYFFRLGDLNSRPIGIAVLVGLVLSLLLISLSTIQSTIFWRRIKNNPSLMESLNNEFIQMLELKSWRAAYIGAVSITVFFALVEFIYPLNDSMLTALTSIIAGAGAYHATFYFLYRSS